MVTSSVVPWKSFLLARTKEGDPSSNKIALWMSGLNDLKSGHVTPQQLVSKVAPSPKRLLLKHVFPKFEMEEIPNNHLGCIKPRKSWDKLPTSTGAGFCPSTVCICNLVVSGKKKNLQIRRTRICHDSSLPKTEKQNGDVSTQPKSIPGLLKQQCM